MAFDREALRIERLQPEINYHAAYLFWNNRGLIAERWAHGPVFGGSQETAAQVTLVPGSGEEDNRLLGIYGIRAAALVGEGAVRVGQVQEHAASWFGDVVQALRPKVVARISTAIFALHPVNDVEKVARQLRDRYYKNDLLRAALPRSRDRYRDTFHAAIDFLVPTDNDGSGLSVVLGTVGPPHRGTFFNFEDKQRDDEWWLGLRYENRLAIPQGIANAGREASALMRTSLSECKEIAESAMGEILRDD